MPTRRPVTVSGYYENTDGSVTYYYWDAGRLLEGSTYASRSDVPKDDPKDDEEYRQWCRSRCAQIDRGA